MTNGESIGAEEIVWDLSDLYAGMDDPQLDADLDACDAEADALDAAYRGRIAGLAAAELAALIARYEALAERAGKIGAFASLNWTQDTQDAARRPHAARHRARLPAQPEAGVCGSGTGRRRRMKPPQPGWPIRLSPGGATGWRLCACTAPTSSASRRRRS